MSDEFKAVLKEMFSKKAEEIRMENGLSQEEMAELLHVTPRAYNDLKQGRYCFSLLPAMFLLSEEDNDWVMDFLRDFRRAAEEIERRS